MAGVFAGFPYSVGSRCAGGGARVWGLKLEACIRNLSSQIREGEVWISLEGCATASAETESLMLEADGKDPQSACCMGTVLAEGGREVTVKKTVWTSQARNGPWRRPIFICCVPF